MADAIFDPFSNITLWIAHRKANKIDERKYPAVIFKWIWLMVGQISDGDCGEYLFLLYHDVCVVDSDCRVYSIHCVAQPCGRQNE